jgi:hypothetical protein
VCARLTATASASGRARPARAAREEGGGALLARSAQPVLTTRGAAVAPGRRASASRRRRARPTRRADVLRRPRRPRDAARRRERQREMRSAAPSALAARARAPAARSDRAAAPLAVRRTACWRAGAPRQQVPRCRLRAGPLAPVLAPYRTAVRRRANSATCSPLAPLSTEERGRRVRTRERAVWTFCGVAFFRPLGAAGQRVGATCRVGGSAIPATHGERRGGWVRRRRERVKVRILRAKISADDAYLASEVSPAH